MRVNIGDQIGDESLLRKLDAATLTPGERFVLDEAMARFVTDGRLSSKSRDQMNGIARAHKLLGATEYRPRRDRPKGYDGGDIFSTRWTVGTDIAASVLDPNWLPLKPPGRAA